MLLSSTSSGFLLVVSSAFFSFGLFLWALLSSLSHTIICSKVYKVYVTYLFLHIHFTRNNVLILYISLDLELYVYEYTYEKKGYIISSKEIRNYNYKNITMIQYRENFLNNTENILPNDD